MYISRNKTEILISNICKKFGLLLNMESIKCKEHPDASVFVDYDTGDSICEECGLVLSDGLYDVGANCTTSNVYMSGSNGNPSNVEESESAFKAEEPSSSQQRNKAKKKEKMLNQVKVFLETSVAKLRCNQAVATEALHIYLKVRDFIKTTVWTLEGTVGACLYLSCQSVSVAHTLKEVTKAIGHSSPKKINKALDVVHKVSLQNNLNIFCDHLEPADIIPRFCESLQLNGKTTRLANAIAKATDKVGEMASRSPVSIAAVAIYMAALTTTNAKDRNEIAKITNAAAVTIMKLYVILYDYKETVLPEDYVPEVQLQRKPRL